MTEYPFNAVQERTLQRAKRTMLELKHFERRLTDQIIQLEMAKKANTSEIGKIGAAAASKRASMDLTKQLAYFRKPVY